MSLHGTRYLVLCTMYWIVTLDTDEEHVKDQEREVAGRGLMMVWMVVDGGWWMLVALACHS